VVYAAAYAVHRYLGVPYMNIAFPLLGGHMTSVLRMNPLGTGLSLTTLPIPHHGGDQGVYFVWRGLTLRLPFNETIDVYDASHPSVPKFPGEDPNTAVFARHDMWLWGIRFLTLHYWLSDEPE